jgi:hypothetical protein
MMTSTRAGTWGIVLLFLAMAIPQLASADAKYAFHVTELPANSFHQPLQAELRFTDAAVAAGIARASDVVALRVTAGSGIPDVSAITMAHLHAAFVELEFVFSDDRRTITAMSARVEPHPGRTNYLVFYFPRPPHPTLQIHEHLAYLATDYVRLETTVVPATSQIQISNFRGEWRRDYGFPILGRINEYLTCFPFCPWPWILPLLLIVAVVLYVRWARARSGKSGPGRNERKA